MSLSIHEVSVPVFVRMLGHLARILDKAAAHAEAGKADPAALLASRLAPDMYPLVEQVRIAVDAAVDGAARLAQVEPPAFAGAEDSFPALQARIQGALAFLQGARARAVRGRGESRRQLVLPRGRPSRSAGRSTSSTTPCPSSTST